jgi:Arc/MetJ family transcription regulator
MRTTLTLDDDVAVRLQAEQRRRGASFRDTVNALLRAGLDARGRRPRSNAGFRTKGFDLGSSLVGSLDNIAEVLARSEGETHG